MRNIYKFAITIGSLLVLGFIILMNSYRFVDVTEFAYKYDLVTGNMSPVVDANGDNKTGWIWKTPFIEKINVIETLPYRQCLGGENVRVLNCVLVRFNPEGWEDFIRDHGRRDYYHNRCNTCSSDDNDLNIILMSYAYDETPSQFKYLTIVEGGRSSKNDTLK